MDRLALIPFDPHHLARFEPRPQDMATYGRTDGWQEFLLRGLDEFGEAYTLMAGEDVVAIGAMVFDPEHPRTGLAAVYTSALFESFPLECTRKLRMCLETVIENTRPEIVLATVSNLFPSAHRWACLFGFEATAQVEIPGYPAEEYTVYVRIL